MQTTTVSGLLFLINLRHEQAEQLRREDIFIDQQEVTEAFHFPGIDKNRKITFSDCIFLEEVIFDDSQNILQLNFHNYIFKSKLTLNKIQCPLDLSGSAFHGMAAINVDQYSFSIKDVSIHLHFVISGRLQEYLHISNVNMQSEHQIGKITIENMDCFLDVSGTNVYGLYIQNSHFNGTFGTIRRLIATELHLSNFIVEHRLLISKCNIRAVIIGAVGDHHAEIIEIRNNSDMGNTHIFLETLRSVMITNTKFSRLTLSGENKAGDRLILDDLEINWLQFVDVFNVGTLTLNNVLIPKGGTLEMKSSNLGKADFLKCDFSRAYFDFENTKIAEIFCSATTFPRRPRERTKEAWAQAQLAYGQLAASFSKQGDTVRSITYQSYEIEAHFQNVHIFSKDFFVWVNLKLNQISNNFGRWWALGLVFTTLVGLLFFWAVVLSTKNGSFATIWTEPRLLISYLKFMNPIRSFDTEALFKVNDVAYLDLSNSSYVWDFIGRIFVAYGFYQTIQAFRRFGRK